MAHLAVNPTPTTRGSSYGGLTYGGSAGRPTPRRFELCSALLPEFGRESQVAPWSWLMASGEPPIIFNMAMPPVRTNRTSSTAVRARNTMLR